MSLIGSVTQNYTQTEYSVETISHHSFLDDLLDLSQIRGRTAL